MAIINPGDVPINEAQVDGTELARRLERLYAVVHSQNSSATRPPAITAGGMWSKTVTGGFDVMMFDGANDVKIGSVINGVATVSQWVNGLGGTIYYNGGNVGIGTSSPSYTLDSVTQNATTSSYIASRNTGATGTYGAGFIAQAGANVNNFSAFTQDTSGKMVIANAAGGAQAFVIGNTERMRIDSIGRVGIGTGSPGAPFDVTFGTTAGALTTYVTKGNSDPNFRLGFRNGAGTTSFSEQAAISFDYSGIDSAARIGFIRDNSAGCHAITFNIGGPSASTERMRIDSNGNLLIGQQTTGFANSNSFSVTGAINQNVVNHASGTPAGAAYFQFGFAGGLVGNILQSGTTGVNYNTTSDYRLKENIAPMTGALAKVAQLKPVTYKWKTDGSEGQGFIAHELQAVVPDCVSGKKDAMRTEKYEIEPAVYEDVVIPAVFGDDGVEVEPESTEKRIIKEAVMGEREVPDYQGIDTSFLVATLTAAIQELSAKVDSQAAKIAALEAK